MIFSCIVPCSQKDLRSQKYQDLIHSIKTQDFPQDQIEILTITEGDSESAKGMGIKQAKGEICAMFCADNMIMSSYFFSAIHGFFKQSPHISALYPEKYYWKHDDNSLNRYFSLIGGNDPICYYLGKNDRFPHCEELTRSSSYQPSYGCNGFFYRSEAIKATDLDNYYPMDNALEIKGKIHAMSLDDIWHRTSDNLITFLNKRYKYAKELYSERTNRRWKMIDTDEDIRNLIWFVISVLTIIPCLLISFRGWLKIKDWAWWLHWPVCFGFLITYGMLAFRNLLIFGNFFQRKSSCLKTI